MARQFATLANDNKHRSGSMMQADCMWTPRPVAIVRQKGHENLSLVPSWHSTTPL